MKEFAPGKINLALRVGKRRADGFHDVDMVMQSISLAAVSYTHLTLPTIYSV